jgi:hypothetical protein
MMFGLELGVLFTDVRWFFRRSCSPPASNLSFHYEERLKENSVGVVRHRPQGPRRSYARTKFLVLLLFAATAAITWQFARQQPVSSLSHPSSKPSPSRLPETPGDKSSLANRAGYSLATHAVRPTYLYSVIPGGVDSAEELRQVVARDPVAAKHFQGFDYQHAHLVEVSGKQSMYVAYRRGDNVYWTRKKIALHPGEKLISDGKITARTRCGNRVAVSPLGPHAIMDPLISDFDQPLFSNDMVTSEAEPRIEPYAATLPSPALENANSLQPTHRRKGFIPLFFVPLGGLGGLSGSSSHTPLAVAPEPGILLLLSTGLAGVFWVARKSRRKR